MSKTFTGRRARGAIVALTLAVFAGGALTGVPAAAATGDAEVSGTVAGSPTPYGSGRYVVLLRDPSAAEQTDLSGELDPQSRAVRGYRSLLAREHNQLARSVGADADRHFTMAANGFTADLTGKQAATLAADRDVLLVQKDERRSLDTWNTPDHLKLSGPSGAWARAAGGPEGAGDGVVVGVLDSGIWPEAPSFGGQPLTTTPRTPWGVYRDGERVHMRKADGGTFRGRCQASHEQAGVSVPAVGWSADLCTTKIVGARYYPEEFLASVPAGDRAPTESLSARDGAGHGTHTASTAAGNVVEDVEVEGVRFGRVSGMAPAAKIAVYKVCFEDQNPDTGDCFTSAILAAIEDAIEDGVDVLNFSISGSRDNVLDAVELGFAAAADAGIFVAASGGNGGPDYYTVSHNSPWVTTVAATTHARFENTVVLGDGTKLRGASIARRGLPTRPLVDSAGIPAVGASEADASLCKPDTLDPAKAAGAIVVCTRGEIDRVAKSVTVQAAGGLAMVLANVEPASLDADFHAVPTIHVADTDSPALFDYLKRAGADAVARFRRGDRTAGAKTAVPSVAGFSARGPAVATGGDLLKPDIAAPGAGILAAVAPTSNSQRSFDLYSGTSMAAPHIAGLAALLMAQHPSWSPMQVKSAMMTTARSVRAARGGRDRDPFGQGAGLVRPSRFADPGLFVTSDTTDWRRFIQGQGLDLGVEPLAARELNVPSLAQAQVAGTTTFTRRFESSRAGIWKVSVRVPGFRAKTARRLVARRAGAEKRLTIEFTRTTAPLNQYSTGFVVLRGPSKLRLPIALRPVAVSAPADVSGSGTRGAAKIPIAAGVTGDLPITATGLAEAKSIFRRSTTTGTGSSDVVRHCVHVAKDSQAVRFDLDAADKSADLDLFVHQAANADCSELSAFVGASATPAADERVTLLAPAPGHYLVEIDPHALGAGGAPVDWRLDFYDVNRDAQYGLLRVRPNPVPVRANRTRSYVVKWSRLSPDRRYLGVLSYEGALSPTILAVDGRASDRG